MTHEAARIREQDAFDHQDFIHFKDGEVAIGLRTPGQLQWGTHKYTRHLDMPGGLDLAVLSTKKADGETGPRYIIGNGVAVKVEDPTYDRPTGKFAAVVPGAALEAVDISTNGLPDAAIGETWDFLNDPDLTVDNVLVKYKIGDMPGQLQHDGVSPFDHARAIVNAARDHLDAQATSGS